MDQFDAADWERRMRAKRDAIFADDSGKSKIKSKIKSKAGKRGARPPIVYMVDVDDIEVPPTTPVSGSIRDSLLDAIDRLERELPR